jgi:hypothetical protein
MASSDMNKEPIDTILSTEVAPQDNLKPLAKAKLDTPPVDTGLDVAPPADDPAEGWYEP